MLNNLIALYLLGALYAFMFYRAKKEFANNTNKASYFALFYETLSLFRVMALLFTTTQFVIYKACDLSLVGLLFFPHEYFTVWVFHKVRLLCMSNKYKRDFDREIMINKMVGRSSETFMELKNFSGLFTTPFAQSLYGALSVIHKKQFGDSKSNLITFAFLKSAKMQRLIMPLVTKAFFNAAQCRDAKFLRIQPPLTISVNNPTIAARYKLPNVCITCSSSSLVSESPPYKNTVYVDVCVEQKFGSDKLLNATLRFEFAVYTTTEGIHIDRCSVSIGYTASGECIDKYTPKVKVRAIASLDCSSCLPTSAAVYLKNAKLKRWMVTEAEVGFEDVCGNYSLASKQMYKPHTSQNSSVVAFKGNTFTELYGDVVDSQQNPYSVWQYPYSITFGLLQTPQKQTTIVLEQSFWS